MEREGREKKRDIYNMKWNVNRKQWEGEKYRGREIQRARNIQRQIERKQFKKRLGNRYNGIRII